MLPKKSALTSYSYRLSHAHQRNFLAALDRQMIGTGLATSGEAVFDLDFHAIMHWGRDPALEKHYVPTRSQRARSVLTFFAQDTGTHNLVYANAVCRRSRCPWQPVAASLTVSMAPIRRVRETRGGGRRHRGHEEMAAALPAISWR